MGEDPDDFAVARLHCCTHTLVVEALVRHTFRKLRHQLTGLLSLIITKGIATLTIPIIQTALVLVASAVPITSVASTINT